MRAVPKRRSWLPQIQLRTLMILTAVIAIWCGVWLGQRQMAALETKLAMTRSLHQELYVEDRSRLAAIKLLEEFYDENRWRVFVPTEGYQLHLATKQIAVNAATYSSPESSVALTPGLHTVELEIQEVKAGNPGSSWSIIVKLDGVAALDVTQPIEWKAASSYSASGLAGTQMQFDAGQPCELMRRTYSLGGKVGSGSMGNGILLWIAD